MDLETILKNYIDPLLPSMYFFDVTNTWVIYNVVNWLIGFGFDQATIDILIVNIWLYILTNKELWKSLDFIGSPQYQISTFGNVKTILTEYITCGSKNDGYMMTILSGNGRKKTQARIHRLVAEAFWPNTENKPTVDHIDRKKENNHILNLKWATYAEQRQNMINKPTNNSGRPVCQYDSNKNFIKYWDNIITASRKLGISHSQICNSCQNLIKTRAGFFWRYYDDMCGDLPGEIWKDIPLLYWDDYLASNMGRIKKKTGKILNGCIRSNGYVMIQISVDGQYISETAHRIIGYTFLNLNENLNMVVNHKNLIKHDNRVKNLKLDTQQYNIIHAVENGAIKAIKVNKLDLKNNIVVTYISIGEAAREMSVSYTFINNSCRSGRVVFDNYILQYG